jgi:hypothetical protein
MKTLFDVIESLSEMFFAGLVLPLLILTAFGFFKIKKTSGLQKFERALGVVQEQELKNCTTWLERKLTYPAVILLGLQVCLFLGVVHCWPRLRKALA